MSQYGGTIYLQTCFSTPIKNFIKYVRGETENKKIRYEEILYFIIGYMLYPSIDIVLEMQISFSSPRNSLVT